MYPALVLHAVHPLWVNKKLIQGVQSFGQAQRVECTRIPGGVALWTKFLEAIMGVSLSTESWYLKVSALSTQNRY